MKLHFTELFEIKNRIVKPKVTVEMGEVKLEKGETYGDVASSKGIDLIKHRNSSFDVVKKDSNTYKVETIYD